MTVEEGANVLVGANNDKLRVDLENHEFPKETGTPYGDGRASEKIADVLDSI